MPEAFALPFHLVNYMTKPGLSCDAGVIPLNQYMSATHKNGGNDNAHSLLKNLRWLKDKGNGPSLNSLVGGSRVDLVLKGQGYPDDFVKIWNFMCRNKALLDTYKVQVAEKRSRSSPESLVIRESGTVFDLYFKGNSDATAIKNMIADRFFGIDCIGFVANFMIYASLWAKYQGYSIPQWGTNVFKTNIKKASDVKRLHLLIWDGHVAFVDWVWHMVDDKTVMIDVCQSSGGSERGPQCNAFALLRETTATSSGRRVFMLSGGTPTVPVDGQCSVMEMDGLYY